MTEYASALMDTAFSRMPLQPMKYIFLAKVKLRVLLQVMFNVSSDPMNDGKRPGNKIRGSTRTGLGHQRSKLEGEGNCTMESCIGMRLIGYTHLTSNIAGVMIIIIIIINSK